MDVSEAKSWCDANLKRVMDDCGIPHWRVTVEYEQKEDKKYAAQCRSYPEYEQAKITLNCPNIVDIEEIARHEILHILHSPFHYYEKLVRELVPDEAKDAIETIWGVACEMTCRNLERMHYSLTHKDKPNDAA